MTAALLRECFVLWAAWQTLVGYLSRSHPAAADPQSIFGAACAYGHDRLAALLYGHGVGDSLTEAGEVLDELLDMAKDGRRPRYGREIGLTPELFGEAGPA